MRVAIIGTVGLPAKYGGFETLTEHLTRNFRPSLDVTVYCSSWHYSRKRANHNGANLRYLPIRANGIHSIPYDLLSMADAARRSDVLLILGVSGCVLLPVLRPLFKGRVIVHIDGQEWKRKKWGGPARSFLKISERLAVKYADAVIADNKAIQEYVLQEYGKPSALIEYGADHVRVPVNRQSGDYAFTVCRIEPENHIHLILEAFSKTKMEYIIVGNWADSEYGRRLRETFGACSHIQMLDPIYDIERLDALRASAKIYVHGHCAGGTNPSLVEAMYLGLPIVAYDVCYNRETTENGARYFASAEELINAINSLDDAGREEIAARMAEVAYRRYLWKTITSKFEEVIMGGVGPECTETVLGSRF